MKLSLERSRVFRVRIEQMKHLVSQGLRLIDIGEMREVFEGDGWSFPSVEDDRVEEGKEEEGEERGRLFDGRFFWGGA